MAMTKEEVAEAVRAWCKAWHTRDIKTLLVMEAPIVRLWLPTIHPTRPCCNR